MQNINTDFIPGQNYLTELNKCKKSGMEFTDHKFELDTKKIKLSLLDLKGLNIWKYRIPKKICLLVA